MRTRVCTTWWVILRSQHKHTHPSTLHTPRSPHATTIPINTHTHTHTLHIYTTYQHGIAAPSEARTPGSPSAPRASPCRSCTRRRSLQHHGTSSPANTVSVCVCVCARARVCACVRVCYIRMIVERVLQSIHITSHLLPLPPSSSTSSQSIQTLLNHSIHLEDLR